MNLIVWGAGQEYIKSKHLIEHLDYILIDSSIKMQGKILDGVAVESPDILYKAEYDYILIATELYFDEVYTELVTKFSVSNKQIMRLRDADKEILMRNIGKYKAINNNGIKIMFGYCFLQYENCRIHDYLLAESLRIRGAEIIPVICGEIQELDCSGYGGVWGNSTHDINEKKIKHDNNCIYCMKCNRQVWNDWGNFSVISANEYITEDEKEFARKFIEKLDVSLVDSWMFEYFPIGEWALMRYFNKELISHKDIWNKIEEKELKSLAYNATIMCIASLKIVETVNPEIIYSNDSFYYPYAILEVIAQKRDIPFYNAYGFRKDTYSYALNTSTVSMDFNSAWKTFSKIKLSDAEKSFMEDYIINRRYGADMMLNTADPFQSVRKLKYDSIYGEISDKKKTVLLAANITWDAAALNKGIVFDNILEWVLYTVELLSNNTKWQLIIKAHPGEVNKRIPEARERICSIVLKKYNWKLPSNIILIDADAPVSVYDLLQKVDLGIVYTTTVGLEMACRGIPIITVAKAPYRDKGFSYDPKNIEEYKEQLRVLMKKIFSKEEIEYMKGMAKKFFFLYYFIYMIPNPLYTFSYEEGAKLKFKEEEELLPNKNRTWDYICESILEKKPILSENRFPPSRLEEII